MGGVGGVGGVGGAGGVACDDADADGACDADDNCPADGGCLPPDADRDGLCDTKDNCADVANDNQADLLLTNGRWNDALCSVTRTATVCEAQDDARRTELQRGAHTLP